MPAQSDRRQSYRYATLSPCVLYLNGVDERATRQGLLIDASHHGALVQCESPLPVGTRCRLELPTRNHCLLETKVARSMVLPDSGGLLGLDLIDEWPYEVFTKLTANHRSKSAASTPDDPFAEYFR